MSAQPTESMQIQITHDQRVQLEQEAAAMNLSVSAYILYLRQRQQSSDPKRWERIVGQVFSKHGELMRRLAK